MARVAALVLTWNGADFISSCLASLAASRRPLSVYVVDNDSSDDTRAIVAKEYPEVTIWNSGSNLGYAGGNNFGLRKILEQDFDYVLVLNPDATVDADCVARLVGRMEADPEMAGISPLITYTGSGKVWYAGSAVNWRTGETPHTGFGLAPDGSYTQQYTERLNGCAMLLRASALRAIGLLDENYFLYFEETDWSARASQAGYRLGFEQTARARHIVSASTGGKVSRTYQYYMARNRLYFMRKFRPPANVLRFAFRRAGMSVLDVARLTRAHGPRAGWLILGARLAGSRDFILRRYGKAG